MPFASVNRHDLYFEDSGGNRPAVIFSHGFLLDHSMWRAQVEAFSGQLRCITWDQRGHGMSDCLGPFDYYDSAADAIGILDHLGIEKATFVGMSQGGFLSLRAAAKFAPRVKSLVLIGTVAGLPDDEVQEAQREIADTWLAQGPVGEIATRMATLIFGPKYKAEPWIGKWQAKPPCEFAHPWEAMLARDDFTPFLKDVRCPSLLIHGSKDAAFPLDAAKALRDGLPDCKGLVVVRGAEHAANLTHAKAVNEALQEFLRKHA